MIAHNVQTLIRDLVIVVYVAYTIRIRLIISHTHTQLPFNRWLYWTDSGGNPSIWKASMDGSNTSILHSDDITSPYSITIDYNTQTLYWADYTLQRIGKSAVDGSNRAVIAADDVGLPFYITFYDNHVFWVDRQIRGIVKSISTIANHQKRLATLGILSIKFKLYQENIKVILVKVHVKLLACHYYLFNDYNSCMHLYNYNLIVENPCEKESTNCNFICLLSSSATE